MVEYIIIVVIVAIAVIAVVGVFSDRIRALFGGATVELGGSESEVSTAVSDRKSADWIRELDETGADD